MKYEIELTNVERMNFVAGCDLAEEGRHDIAAGVCDKIAAQLRSQTPKTGELLNITQISELQDNLELTGFTHDEAFQIILTVIKRG